MRQRRGRTATTRLVEGMKRREKKNGKCAFSCTAVVAQPLLINTISLGLKFIDWAKRICCSRHTRYQFTRTRKYIYFSVALCFFPLVFYCDGRRACCTFECLLFCRMHSYDIEFCSPKCSMAGTSTCEANQ